MIAAAVLLFAAAGVTTAFDGSCTSTGAEPGLAAIGEVLDFAAPEPVVYRDAPAGDLTREEKSRREVAINRATDALDVRPGGEQVGDGRCAAIVLKSVFTYHASNGSGRKNPNLDEIVSVAKEKGWTSIGELNSVQMKGIAEHYGYQATVGGAKSFADAAASIKNRTPLIVGLRGKRGDDPVLKQYDAHVIVVTGTQEVDGVQYLIGYDPNFPDGKRAWRYTDVAAAWSETITVTPG